MILAEHRFLPYLPRVSSASTVLNLMSVIALWISASMVLLHVSALPSRPLVRQLLVWGGVAIIAVTSSQGRATAHCKVSSRLRAQSGILQICVGTWRACTLDGTWHTTVKLKNILLTRGLAQRVSLPRGGPRAGGRVCKMYGPSARLVSFLLASLGSGARSRYLIALAAFAEYCRKWHIPFQTLDEEAQD